VDVVGRDADLIKPGREADMGQHSGGIGRHLHSRSDLTEPRCSLNQLDFVAVALQAEGRRQSTNTYSGHDHSHLGILAGLFYGDRMIEVTNDGRVRTITLQRSEAKNAMSVAMWDATTEAFLGAQDDPTVAVVVLTGSGDSFSAGQDVIEMGRMAMGEKIEAKHGFAGLTKVLIDFPKPLVLAVNGMGLGFGATILGVSDLVFMSSGARLKCPFTTLGVAPELASSVTFPSLIGRQNATWALMSAEWLTADECKEMGLAFKVCAPGDLMNVTMDHARTLASRPISSLKACKRTIVGPIQPLLHEAHERENGEFAVLMGAPANIEAMTAFAEKRTPNFEGID